MAKAEDQVAKGKPEEAVKTLQKAATQSPGSEAQAALGNLQAKLGNFDEATAAFAKAKELSATEPPATKAATFSAVALYHLSACTAKDALAAARRGRRPAHGGSAAASARAEVRSNDVLAPRRRGQGDRRGRLERRGPRGQGHGAPTWRGAKATAEFPRPWSSIRS